MPRKKKLVNDELNEINEMDCFIKDSIKKLDFKIKLKFKNEKQKLLYDTIMENKITFVSGSPGSGKSLITLMAALDIIKNDKQYGDIILVKPIVEVSRSIGLLPGTVQDKIYSYFTSFYDNLTKLIGPAQVSYLKDNHIIKDSILNFLRGSTFNSIGPNGKTIGSVVILDECFTGDTKISTDIYIDCESRVTKQSNILTIVNNFKKGKDINVLSFNEIEKKIEKNKVIGIFENGEKDILNIKLELRKKPIKTTENHPFYIFKNGEITQTLSSNLKKDDLLIRFKKSNSNNSDILTKESYDILLGFLLGDGSLSRNKQIKDGYRLSINHGLSQKDYIEFCRIILNAKYKKGIKSGYTGNPILGIITKTLNIDENFINSLYNLDRKKSISKDIEEYFSIRTLSIWMMDDGYYNPKTKSFFFNSHGFSKEENIILINILKNKFNLDSSLLNEKGVDYNYYYITIFIENNFNIDNYKINFYDNLTISKVEDIYLEGKELTYNIEVENNNNYFAEDILVHNCQNSTIHEMKTFISRMGEGSKLIILGDPEQIDIKLIRGEKCGLVDAIDRLMGISGIGLVEFNDDDIVRDPFLIEIMKRYKNP